MPFVYLQSKGLVSLFNGISTFVDCSLPKPTSQPPKKNKTETTKTKSLLVTFIKQTRCHLFTYSQRVWFHCLMVYQPS